MGSEGFQSEIDQGERFEFGKNWQRFLSTLTEERITIAESSLRECLDIQSLEGRTFLDIGCGSGLFSLAAMRLSADNVHSIDYDPQSVACAAELKAKFFSQAQHWTIELESVLDADYLQKLGEWDIVYSWGVLHHTGHMWTALNNVVPLVKEDGFLFISIYNDQGGQSRRWRKVKSLYVRNTFMKWLVLCFGITYFVLQGLAVDVGYGRNPLKRYRDYKKNRGMSQVHDFVDWLGGYPFEVAKPEEIFDFYRRKGFVLKHLKTCGGGLGCNEFVFQRATASSDH